MIGMGIINGKNGINYGTLLRSCYLFNADFAFIIGRRFKKQSSDTVRSERNMPVFEFKTFNDALEHTPNGFEWVLVELCPGAVPLPEFKHPQERNLSSRC